MPLKPGSLQIVRFSLSFVWFYQGLVPKLLGPHADEVAISMTLGLDPARAAMTAYAGGVGEIGMGLLVLMFYGRPWPYLLTLAGMAGLLAFTVLFAPQYLNAAFNPVTANASAMALACIGWNQLRSESAPPA